MLTSQCDLLKKHRIDKLQYMVQYSYTVSKIDCSGEQAKYATKREYLTREKGWPISSFNTPYTRKLGDKYCGKKFLLHALIDYVRITPSKMFTIMKLMDKYS